MIFTNSFKVNINNTEFDTAFTAEKDVIIFNFVVANKSETGDFISIQVQTQEGETVKQIWVVNNVSVPYASTFVFDGKIVLKTGDKILVKSYASNQSLDLTMSIIEV